MFKLTPTQRTGVPLHAHLLSHVAMIALLAGSGTAAAQNLSNVPTLPTSTGQLELIQPGVSVIYQVPVNAISPTQSNVGDSEVAKKTADWNYVAPSDLTSTIQGSIEPIIIGPGGTLYLENGHHTFTSLQDSIYGSTNPDVYVNVVANYSTLTPQQFVSVMESTGAVYPVNDGVPQTINPASGSLSPPLPTTLQGLSNDPYRGLEFSVLKNNFNGVSNPGFDKTGDDFSDYIWANAYRNAPGISGATGLPYASPYDVTLAASYSQTAGNAATIVGVTTPGASGTTTTMTMGQLPGFILPSNINVTTAITNGNLGTGALSASGAMNGLNGLYLTQNGNQVTLEPAQPGFVMQLGNNTGNSVTLSNGSNAYTGGTFIAAGDLVTAINVGAGGHGDALGAAATGVTIDLSNGNLNVLGSVQAANGIVFDSLSEGNGTLTFGTNATSSGTTFTENRNIAVGGETAIIDPNGNTVTLIGQIATANTGEGGFAGLTIDGKGTVVLNPTASAGNSGFYGDFIIAKGTLDVMSNSAFGSTAANTASEIELDNGTFQAGTNLNSTGTNFFLHGSQSTLDVNGNNSSFGNFSDTQRSLEVINSQSAAGSVSFTSTTIGSGATADITIGKSTGNVAINLGAVSRDGGNGTLILQPSTSTISLGSTSERIFATSVPTTNGIVQPWIIIDSTNSVSHNPYSFAGYNATSGFVSAGATSDGTSASITTSVATDVVLQSANATVTGNAQAYALEMENKTSITTSSGKTLTLGDGVLGGLIMNGGAQINGGALSFNGGEGVVWVKGSTSNANSIGSVITSGSLTLAGSGTLILNAANTYTGMTTVESGTLQLNVANAIADSSGVTLSNDNSSAFSQAILAINANQNIATLNDSGNNSTITMTTGSTLTVGSGSVSSTIVSGDAGAGGTLVKTGSGLLDLSGDSGAVLAGVTVGGGQLRIVNNTFASNSTGIALVGGSELQFGQGGGGTFGNSVTGSGDLRLLGGTLQITGSNNYSGGTYVEWGGTLDTSTGSMPAGGNIHSSGTVVFDQNTSGAFGGVIGDGVAGQMIGSVQAGNFIKDDSSGGNGGNVTFTQAQSYTGSTTIEAGTVTLNALNTIASSISVDLGRIGGGAIATLSLGADNLVNALNSEQGDTATVALNGHTLTVNDAIGQQSTYRGGISDTGGGAVVKTGVGTLDLAGPSSGSNIIAGSVTVSQGTLAVSGNVNFTGTVTNNAAFVSDPADLTFANLNIGTTGFIQAAPGDVYDITGNFINQSTQSGSWSTGGATLQFSGGTSHVMALTALDLGNAEPIDNAPFAWGDLELGPGDTLTLEDGLAGPGIVALYVDAITGLDITGDDVTNIFDAGGFDIYYDAYSAADAYLDDGTYRLADGGELIADAPEPAALPVMLSALLGLGGLRRKRRT